MSSKTKTFLLIMMVAVLIFSISYLVYAEEDCCCDSGRMCCCGEREGYYLGSYSCNCAGEHCENECNFIPVL